MQKNKILFLAISTMLFTVCGIFLFGISKNARADQHQPGANVLYNGTVFFITADNQRRPYTSAGDFISYPTNNWANVMSASTEDLALPQGSLMPPADGSLINDQNTIYLISKHARLGFTNAKAFLDLGYNFSNTIPGDTSFLSDAGLITSADIPHPYGTLINEDGTIYMMTSFGKIGIPSEQIFNSWGYKWSQVVPANDQDRQVAVSSNTISQISPGYLDPIVQLSANPGIPATNPAPTTVPPTNTGSGGAGSGGGSGGGAGSGGNPPTPNPPPNPNPNPNPNPTAPTINSFTATPQSITSGQSSTLAWVTTAASSLSIDPISFTSSQVSGSTTVSPTQTTTYTLTATNAVGSVTSQVVITITTQPSPQPSPAFNFNPSTSFTAETVNNTSAADSFAPMSSSRSGTFNPAGGPVSHVDIHSLLAGGKNVKVFGHLTPWFKHPATSHIDIGYTSNDATQVDKTINDLVARGLDGAIIDWYGPNSSDGIDGFTQKLRDNTAPRCSKPQSCPLLFALMEDQGSFKGSCGTTNQQCIQNKIISDFDYMNTSYFGSNSYFKISGRPAVFFFIDQSQFSIDWTSVWNNVQAHLSAYPQGQPYNGVPVLIYENSGGFSHIGSNGAFAWVGDSNYYTDFYKVGASSGQYVFGSAFKGFDGTYASWHPGAFFTQNCGQNWLNTIKQASQSNAPFIQLATWNDYEEGTELETGIDNCWAINAQLKNNILSWQPTVNSDQPQAQTNATTSTLDHYKVFLADQNGKMQVLADNLPISQNSFDISGLNIPASGYSLYVQAIGKPFFTNKISAAVAVTAN